MFPRPSRPAWLAAGICLLACCAQASVAEAGYIVVSVDAGSPGLCSSQELGGCSAPAERPESPRPSRPDELVELLGGNDGSGAMGSPSQSGPSGGSQSGLLERTRLVDHSTAVARLSLERQSPRSRLIPFELLHVPRDLS